MSRQHCSVEKLTSPKGVPVAYSINVYSNERSQVVHLPSSYPITIGIGKKISVGQANRFNTVQIWGASTKISETSLFH